LPAAFSLARKAFQKKGNKKTVAGHRADYVSALLGIQSNIFWWMMRYKRGT
jgi:hypothetical protein